MAQVFNWKCRTFSALARLPTQLSQFGPAKKHSLTIYMSKYRDVKYIVHINRSRRFSFLFPPNTIYNMVLRAGFEEFTGNLTIRSKEGKVRNRSVIIIYKHSCMKPLSDVCLQHAICVVPWILGNSGRSPSSTPSLSYFDLASIICGRLESIECHARCSHLRLSFRQKMFTNCWTYTHTHPHMHTYTHVHCTYTFSMHVTYYQPIGQAAMPVPSRKQASAVEETWGLTESVVQSNFSVRGISHRRKRKKKGKEKEKFRICIL